MTAQLSPTPIFKGWANDGTPLAYGKLWTYAAGTTTPQATYVDSSQTTQNTNPIILNARGECALWLNPALSYKFSLFDLLGNQIPGYPVDNIQGQLGVSSNLIPAANNVYSLGSPSFAWAQLYLGPNAAPAFNVATGNIGYYAPLSIEGTSVVNPSYPYGNLFRYGATGGPAGTVPTTDDSAAWQAAVTTGVVVIPVGFAFKIVTGATYTGEISVTGQGATSQIYCDSTYLTVTNGSNSFCFNYFAGSVTSPWVIQRDPTNLGATVTTLVNTSATPGYQPTSNDPEYTSQAALWNSLYGTSWSTQNIGPVLQFQGAASNIVIDQLYGNFARINLYDAVQSTIRDCVIRGGKGNFAAIYIDNASNNVQRGSGNRAFNNEITYASFCGITWVGNDDFVEFNNSSSLNGESGLQTAQAGGVQFTANVAGATSGTLTTAWPYGAGTWYLGFNDGSVRTTTVAASATVVTWSPALSSGTIVLAAVWGIGAEISSTIDPRCYRGRINGNSCVSNFYDGLDCLSIYPPIDATLSRHNISDNYSYNNYGVGISSDGRLNSVKDNHIYNCGDFGIWGVCSDSDIDSNYVDTCNTRLISSAAGIVADGLFASNKVSNNYVNTAPSDNGYAIYAPPSPGYGANDLINNKAIGPSLIFAGNPGQIVGVFRGNTDNSTGLLSPQSFVVELQNSGGTLQHIFYSDASGSSVGRYDKVSGATSGGFTSTPTGSDATTAFAAGAKIGSASTNILWLNTNAQLATASILSAIIEADNATTTNLAVAAVIESLNINGVTQTRLGLQFANSTGAFALTTSNIASGKGLIVRFNGELA